MHPIIIREEPLMIWGGSGKSAKKKTQQLLAQEKKNSTQQPRRKKNSTQQPGRKKNHHGLYAGLRCPEHGDTWLLHTIYVQITN